MWKNVPYDRLQRGVVPQVCAKTGVPTTTVRKQHLVQRRKWSLVWWLLFGVYVYIAGWVTAHRATVWLPIAPEVLRRHRLMRLACVAYPFVVMALGSAVVPEGTARQVAGWAALGGFVLLVRATHRTWVQPQWAGIVRLRDPHPRFLDAVRNVVVIRGEDGTVRRHDPVVARPAGWYPDPSGEHAHRYWSGGAWTEQVMGAPSATSRRVGA